MFLKLLSIPELNFQESWNNGWNKVKNLNTFDKYMTLFWFLGPFIYLIERDPADLWLSILSVIFLYRCYKKKDWYWAKQIWFKLALLLWGFGLFSAITSPDPFFSFSQGFVWIRFPLYAAASQAWLAKDRDIRVVMLLSMFIGMLIMCTILITESILHDRTRLTWPYGDTVPGGYLARVSLPLFCVLVAIAVSRKNKSSFISGIIALLSMGVSILTGERNHFIMRACAGILSGIIWKPKVLLFGFLVLIEVIAILIIIFFRSDLSDRFGKYFLGDLPIVNMSDKNAYWGSWRGGIQQGLITPVKGIGPSGTRKTCKMLNPKSPSWLPGKNYCGNHPHNFYVQLFAETGVIGLIIGSTLFISILITCFKARIDNFNCPMSATAFIIPLAFFFPIQQFGSFYGQWGNLFLWFGLGFAISQYQGWRKSNQEA